MIYFPISMLIAFSVSSFLLIDQADSLRCRLMSEYEVYRRLNGCEKLIDCLPCPKCPLGHGLEPQCGSRIPQDAEIKCMLCDQGKSYSKEESVQPCKPCNDCGNRQILKNCTIISNRKCHDTKCLPGYYFDELLSDCRRCSLCCVEKNDLQHNVIAPECAHRLDNRKCKISHRHCLKMAVNLPALATTPTLSTTLSTNSSTQSVFDKSRADMSQSRTSWSTTRSIALKKHENLQSDPTIASKKEYTFKSFVNGLFVLFGLVWCCFLVAFVWAIVYVDNVKSKRKNVGPNCQENNAFEMRGNENEEEFQRLLERVPEDIKVSEMPPDLREKVQMMLDTPTSQNGWRKVGQILGLDRTHLGYLNTEFLKPNGSPISQILEILNASCITMTVRELFRVIHRAKRHDIAREICNWQWNGYYETVI